MSDEEQQWVDNYGKFTEEFIKESDRACVVLGSAKLDNMLGDILKKFLRPIPSSNDSLFDGHYAPLSNFGPKIDFAYRLGIIDVNLCKILHLVRKIRNEFAHGLEDCNFTKSQVINRVNEMKRELQIYTSSFGKKTDFGKGIRANYSLMHAFLMGIFIQKLETITRIK